MDSRHVSGRKLAIRVEEHVLREASVAQLAVIRRVGREVEKGFDGRRRRQRRIVLSKHHADHRVLGEAGQRRRRIGQVVVEFAPQRVVGPLVGLRRRFVAEEAFGVATVVVANGGGGCGVLDEVGAMHLHEAVVDHLGQRVRAGRAARLQPPELEVGVRDGGDYGWFAFQLHVVGERRVQLLDEFVAIGGAVRQVHESRESLTRRQQRRNQRAVETRLRRLQEVEQSADRVENAAEIGEEGVFAGGQRRHLQSVEKTIDRRQVVAEKGIDGGV